ncbi:hypothetical protein CEUSTIGMA_g3979.t1 [Chlamydomonas eustigma]|uniref:Sialate O-acetylesterase domain-containing protein n=1 Tax=Chlamydomonas eustigma TaxID=1157962 RepID=A0A250X0D0_9CHLO|nr:hypothetical protein CEUSTIGMA_g3979.t1 [Chlamydomonas eustigma]|eukprot:GAX76533.1 hypothetical protein CEUSTIGMA_g3979.t1 [Chlamydomonas eustigma]
MHSPTSWGMERIICSGVAIAIMCTALSVMLIAAIVSMSQTSVPSNLNAKDQYMDIWVLAGQSNMVGFNFADGQEMPETSKPLPGRILMFTPDNTWTDAVPNVHLGVHSFPSYLKESVGPEMAFAKRLISAGVSSKIGFIPTAKGGSNLFQDWRPPDGELYVYMVQRVHRALQNQSHMRLRGILWVQGEFDGFTNDTALAYAANFQAFVESVRSEVLLHTSNLTIITAVMAAHGGRDAVFPFLETVRQQQLNFSMKEVVKVEMSGYEFFPEAGSFIHLSKAGVCAFGSAMADKYVDHVVADHVVAEAGGHLSSAQGQATATAVQSVDVWILAGQSNTVGENGPDSQAVPDSARPWYGRILKYNNEISHWIDAVPNVHVGVHGYHVQNSTGPDMVFARTLIERGKSQVLGFIPTAFGGSNLSVQWRAPEGEMYRYMVQQTRQALKKSTSYSFRLRGMIWIQGETDGLTKASAEAYGENLKSFWAALCMDLSYFIEDRRSCITLVMGIMMVNAARVVDLPFLQTVRDQQQQIALNNVVKVDMSGFEFFNQSFSGRPTAPIHLTKFGQCAFGSALAHTYLLQDDSSHALRRVLF